MESFLKLKKDNADTDPKNSSYMKQAEHLWTMLDEMASSTPSEYKKFIEKTLKEGKEAMRPPEPHMCVKTQMKRPKNLALFVNIFSWHRVPAPESEDHPIPVFGRDVEYVKNIAVVNMAFNDKVIDKYGKEDSDPVERDLLIKLAFKYIENQNKVNVEENEYKIVESTNCYGDVKDCVFKLTKNGKNANEMSDLELAKEALSSMESNQVNLPDSVIKKIANLNIDKDIDKKVQDMSMSSEKKSLIQEVNEEPAQIPAYEESIINDKENVNKAIFDLKIKLPKISSMSECQLNIDNLNLTLDSNELYYKQLSISLLELNKKYEILSDDIEAKFVKKSCILKVKIPLVLKS